ncbi:hypothetical protein HRW18_17935 [Streptomyces lunaelactis]|uniref:hypothetical protein n=1 Tax=Streptomyces lunaelactis TaxID=1535768 RepID=UPI001585C3FE|nr:hypothetical protein [Streptomyces lunaelactis]NUK09847.1 hypothetical protein [Streptomyces lunaelactis]NUK23964.1 hypothetical protein [Streptomyces lunaelactis]NUK36188.1 hypothetical protein [Streptomyces lunaelactis]NUK42763.1 hypothetical protein [Streptomyces lunaelactis]NUK52215.1 hypothetical protein [Streptomyces lunaelactis]
MPTNQRNSSTQAAPSGWRMDPIPSRPAYKDEDGNVRIPIWLTKNGRHTADTEMVLLPSEAELLSERLTDAIGDPRSTLQALLHAPVIAQGPGVTVVSKLPHSA